MSSTDKPDSATQDQTLAEEGTQGWDAIDQALEKVYGDQQAAHFGTLIKFRLGGPDPLDGISVYRSEQGQPHWHYVTYGFSDLYGDLDDSLDIAPEKPSGYGFELTFRLARAADEQEPPSWPLNFLQNIARYVFRTGNVFAPGHWMTANGPIATESDTRLTEMGFVEDPELPPIHSPFGKLSFLEVVGLTAEELQDMRRWNVRGALKAMEPHLPLWVTDLSRASLHELPDVKSAVDAGAAKDGSKTGVLYSDVLNFQTRKRLLRSTQNVIEMGSLAVRDLKALLPARLPHGRNLTLAGESAALEFTPAPAGQGGQLEVQGDGQVQLSLNDAQMRAWINSVKGRDGEYSVPGLDGLIWQVKNSVITDSDGKVTGKYEE